MPRKASQSRAAGSAPALPPQWEAVRPKTLVDHAVEAIIAGAARGVILPGDRIVESEISRALGISRVPVREALRLLESQGLVISEPYKGIKLAPMTQDRLRQVLEVRTALEVTAARRALEHGHNDGAGLVRLRQHVEDMALMAARRDPYGLANVDTAFHRELCRLGGNDVLCSMWEGLARQLTIIFGLSTHGKPMRAIVNEHRVLLEAFASGDVGRITETLYDHIVLQNEAVDLARLVERRRRERDEAPAPRRRDRAQAKSGVASGV